MPEISPAAQGLTRYGAASRRRWGIAAGVAVSLLLHGVLIFGYRFGLTPAPLPQLPHAEMLTVWVRPAPPPTPVKPPPPPEPVKPKEPPRVLAQQPPKEKEKPERLPAPARELAQKPDSAPPVTESQAITLPGPVSAPPPDPFAEPRAADAKPAFDMDAARRTARKMANEPDPAKAGTALARLPQKQLESETEMAKRVSQAKRPDCKDGLPGGLLAPLFLMMDKKDHGCKW
ncbi:hypothetical protein HSX11_07310 [Oxalobacteraceae bacterium]|nr:hypothetical protein [Oxalobacteraceae bacterium]